MSHRSIRFVSLMLVTVFATLASAGVLCLLPCELTPDVTSTKEVQSSDHCSGHQAALPQDQTTVAAADDTCGGHHAWEGPAADRTSSRASATPTAAAASIDLTNTHGTVASVRGSVLPVALIVGPPPGLTPLRI